MSNTGHTQQNGAVSIVNTIETAPFFCVCPVYLGPSCKRKQQETGENGTVKSSVIRTRHQLTLG